MTLVGPALVAPAPVDKGALDARANGQQRHDAERRRRTDEASFAAAMAAAALRA